jgi:transposase
VIGDATAVRWVKRWRETGSFEARSVKGLSRSPLKIHEDWLLELVRQEPDLTLEIQRRLLDECQQKVGLGSNWRFSDRRGISLKKAFERPSRIGLTSQRSERPGRTINPSSIATGFIAGLRSTALFAPRVVDLKLFEGLVGHD